LLYYAEECIVTKLTRAQCRKNARRPTKEEKKARIKLKTKRGKWHPKYYVEAYRLAASGLMDKTIAGHMGVNLRTFNHWKQRHPTFEWALAQGRNPKKIKGTQDVMEFVYDRLPSEYKEVYNKICKVDKGKHGYQRVREILTNKGKRVKQHIFLYAIVRSNFNKSEAMKTCCVSKYELKRWMDDPKFVGFMDQIKDGIKDFYESALVERVKEGDTQATIFANRTLNRDRGYGDTVQVEHTGKIEHSHLVQVDVSTLSMKAQKEIYNQLEEREKETEELEEMNLGKGQKLLMNGKG
jgi:hypothetical protein